MKSQGLKAHNLSHNLKNRHNFYCFKKTTINDGFCSGDSKFSNFCTFFKITTRYMASNYKIKHDHKFLLAFSRVSVNISWSRPNNGCSYVLCLCSDVMNWFQNGRQQINCFCNLCFRLIYSKYSPFTEK